MTEPPTPVAEFQVTSETSDDTVVITVRGDVDVSTAPHLREHLRQAAGRHVVVDLSAMTFIDSTGLGVLVGTVKRLREDGGDLTLRSPSRSTRKVLDITGLDQIMTIED